MHSFRKDKIRKNSATQAFANIVSGTGALVATLYSSGFTPKQMVELFEGMNFFKDIVTPAVPKGGLFDSRPLVELLRKHLPYTRLEELPIPTLLVASDLEHGIPKVFTKGEIAPRVVASCSIPVIFQPMIALNDIDKTAVVAEIKRQKKKLNPDELNEKAATIEKELAKYSVKKIGLSMEDM